LLLCSGLRIIMQISFGWHMSEVWLFLWITHGYLLCSFFVCWRLGAGVTNYHIGPQERCKKQLQYDHSTWSRRLCIHFDVLEVIIYMYVFLELDVTLSLHPDIRLCFYIVCLFLKQTNKIKTQTSFCEQRHIYYQNRHMTDWQHTKVVMGGTHGTIVYRDTKFSWYQYRRGNGTLWYYL